MFRRPKNEKQLKADEVKLLSNMSKVSSCQVRSRQLILKMSIYEGKKLTKCQYVRMMELGRLVDPRIFFDREYMK